MRKSCCLIRRSAKRCIVAAIATTALAGGAISSAEARDPRDAYTECLIDHLPNLAGKGRSQEATTADAVAACKPIENAMIRRFLETEFGPTPPLDTAAQREAFAMWKNHYETQLRKAHYDAAARLVRMYLPLQN